MPKYKLVCFDVDGTLVDGIKTSWQLFHEHFKTPSHIREDTKNRFFSGKITYREWAEHDIMLWKQAGATRKEFLSALKGTRLMEGAMDTLKELKKSGIKLAIISGSLSIILEKLIPGYRNMFDDVFISSIHFDEGGSISGIDATEYDIEGKSIALKLIAKRENLSLDECAFVGDFLNDIWVMKDAGLGIAFNCDHDEVRSAANVVIKKKDLREILPYILQ
jgi:phosphoserine phosphatase